jgi:hypothetical protein
MRQEMAGIAMLPPPWRANTVLGVLRCVATWPSMGGGELVKHPHPAVPTRWLQSDAVMAAMLTSITWKLVRLLSVEKCCW